jgi:HKD family nuclease
MNNYQQSHIELDTGIKKHIPVCYHFIYRFSKKGVKQNKGKAYYGVKAAILNTTQYYTSGHPKAISKIFDFDKVRMIKSQANNAK